MKYLLYAIWLSIIFLGAFIYPCIPDPFKYIYAFSVGSMSEVFLICARGK